MPTLLEDPRSVVLNVSITEETASLISRLSALLEVDSLEFSALLPKRGFSSLRSDLVEVQFRPLSVGVKEALVQLSRSSRRTVSGRLRQIKLHLGDETAGGLADQLFQAAKSCTWMWASCRVIDNRDGVAKSLLLESIRVRAV